MTLQIYKAYKYIQQKYLNLHSFIQTKHTNDDNIKLIIYDFDEVITYWNLHKYINSDIDTLKHMRNLQLINDIFAGVDRLDRLRLHFNRILSVDNMIHIAIISFGNTNIIKMALQKVHLLQYFTNSDIIATDTSKYLNIIQSKLNDIIDLAKQYKLNLLTQVLFIDHELNHIETIKSHCITYHVYSQYTLNGLSMA
eukprot:68292_1